MRQPVNFEDVPDPKTCSPVAQSWDLVGLGERVVLRLSTGAAACPGFLPAGHRIHELLDKIHSYKIPNKTDREAVPQNLSHSLAVKTRMA